MNPPSHQLSKQRFTRLDDYLRHLYVRPLGTSQRAIWHQQRQLLVVERAQSQQPLKDRQDVSDEARLILGKHHHPVDIIHRARSLHDHGCGSEAPPTPAPLALPEPHCGGRAQQVHDPMWSCPEG
jgi:hypothetical protein